MANTKKYVSLDKLSLYDEKIKKVITDGDAAALKSAKDYADSLAGNYDAAGSAATEAGKVQANLDTEVSRAKAEEARIAGLVATAQGEVDALELVVDTKAAQSDLTALSNKVGEVPADKTVMGIIAQIQADAYDDSELRGLISNLDTNKADKTQVATDIAAAVKVETDARVEAINGVQDAVDTLSQTHAADKASIEGRVKAIEDDYLKAADKTELEGKIDAVSEVANAAVKQSDYDVKVKALEDEDARIVGLVEAEATKAREEEGKLDARLVEVETFFKTAEGETLDTALDTLVELQKYLDGEGKVADQMLLDIAANAKAIEDHVTLVDHNFAAADATLKSELEGKIALKADASVVEAMDTAYKAADTEIKGRLDVLEAIDHDAYVAADTALENKLNAEIAKKADITALNSAVEALEGVDAGQETRIAALEAKFGEGEGNVEDMIADAKQEAIDAAAAAADAKDAVILAEAKADSSNKDAVVLAEAQKGIDAVQSALDAHIVEANAVAGRVATAEGEIDTLQSEMDAVEALAAANDAAHKANAAAIALKASQDDLNALDARVVILETWHNNFTEVSEEEINALFA